MPPSFWAAYGIKLAIVAALLAGLYALGRFLRRLPARRCVEVLDARGLSAQPALYVVRAGARYFLVGTGSSGVCKIAELAPSDAVRPADRPTA